MTTLDDLTKEDILVLSGNIQSSIPLTLYADILKRIADKQVLALVDAQKEALRTTLPYHPFLIKPNKQELEEMFHTKLKTREDILSYARCLQAVSYTHLQSRIPPAAFTLTASPTVSFIKRTSSSVAPPVPKPVLVLM